jgi:O-acetyl-ADP-ribose deacetylase (regulator of RNase III)
VPVGFVTCKGKTVGHLTYKKSDLFVFRTEPTIIAHGCNCRGGFGSGVAGQVARLYPQAREAYLAKYKSEGWQLGEVQYVSIIEHRTSLWVANMATQDTYGGPGVHVDYEAVKNCFDNLLAFAEGVYAVSIPKIGAGLGGGDWEIIESIIVDRLKNYDVEVTCHCID